MGSCDNLPGSPDVWYSYTAVSSGLLHLSPCNATFDTILSVYQAGRPVSTTTEIACNDDCGGSPCGGLKSCLTVPVEKFGWYLFRFAGYEGRTGNLKINLHCEADSDRDGIPDEVENAGCTSPTDADSDDDGIVDGREDANHDGVVDSGETDPCDADTDGDGRHLAVAGTSVTLDDGELGGPGKVLILPAHSSTVISSAYSFSDSSVVFSGCDTAAQTTWNGWLTFASPPAAGHSVLFSFGVSTGYAAGFEPSSAAADATGDGTNYILPYSAAPGSFMVPKGKHLAVRLENGGDSNVQIMVGGAAGMFFAPIGSHPYRPLAPLFLLLDLEPVREWLRGAIPVKAKIQIP